jgi:hypothetical protein
MAMIDLKRLGMTNGIWADFWVTNEKQIGKFINKNKLTPVARSTAAFSIGRTKKLDIDDVGPIDGGMKVPHFHYRGDVYLLKPKQWREFSGAVVDDLRKRLADADQGSFDELLDLTNAAGSIMR